MSAIVHLSEGNPGALAVIGYLGQQDPEQTIFNSLLKSLNDSGLRGIQIWIAYKDYCKTDISLFKSLLIMQDVNMINFAMKESF